MAIKSLFPEGMIEASGGNLSLDTIKAKLNYFELQLHELHWQTRGFAEHEALGKIYDKVFDLKDEIVEKIMGYSGVRTKAMSIQQIKDYSPGLSEQVVKDLKMFAKQLENFGESNDMPDIENIAQSLSGEAAQTLYRLTLS
jgi:DNA-binding ferritin-like protein